jgi:hypothetical protein
LVKYTPHSFPASLGQVKERVMIDPKKDRRDEEESPLRRAITNQHIKVLVVGMIIILILFVLRILGVNIFP